MNRYCRLDRGTCSKQFGKKDDYMAYCSDNYGVCQDSFTEEKQMKPRFEAIKHGAPLANEWWDIIDNECPAKDKLVGRFWDGILAEGVVEIFNKANTIETEVTSLLSGV